MGEEKIAEYTNATEAEEIEESAVADKISQDFKVNLPGQDLPTPIRFIAFFSLIGGLSIIGSLFADIVRPNDEALEFFILRVVAGLLALAIAYGIVEKERWCIWLYLVLTFIAVAANLLFAIIPLVVLIYLYIKRDLFSPSIIDVLLSRGIESIKSKIKSGGTPPPLQV